jgi:glycine dehydrogenase
MVDHAAYFATKEDYKRSMPGRIIGVSQDADGNRAPTYGFTNTCNTKREKQHLIFVQCKYYYVMAGMFAVYHGPKYIAEKYIRLQEH